MLVSCNSQLSVKVEFGNETIYDDRFSGSLKKI